MNVVVIGLGSMGRRRIRLLRQYDKKINIVGIDSKEERRSQSEKEFGISSFESLEAIRQIDNMDCAFVCTPPLTHAEVISYCLRNDMHVFTEINLHEDGYDENVLLARKKSKILFLSSTLLYRREIQYIKKIIREYSGELNYQYHVGQYLPDWHPWENYKDFFVGKKETNGCREFMAIDFPWILSVFGTVKDYSVIKRKVSSLDLPYDDTYNITLQHEKAIGQIIVDVVSSKAVRQLEVSGEQLYLTWDGTPDGLRIYDRTEKKEKTISLYDTVEKRADYNSSIIEDAYLEEIVSFFSAIEGTTKPRYSVEDDKKTLELINNIEGGE